jgi:nucleotide-binding universal stress UspA family protein
MPAPRPETVENGEMALKDILVQVDATERAMVHLSLAVYLAKQHAAHVTGLYVVDVQLPPVALGADGLDAGLALTSTVEQLRRDARAQASRVEAIFRERLRLDGVAGEWRLVEGVAATLVTAHARYADLTIFGQPDPDGDDPGPGAIVEEALFSSGRPLLVVPFAGEFQTVGRTALIGWNASREAARAVNDALPLLARAVSTTVVTVDSGDRSDGLGEAPATTLAVHLQRHGIRAGVKRIVAGEIGAGDALLNHAADASADLLVVGAYSHSRLREVMLGGVTRTLLRHMTVPVLLSH